VCSPVREGKCSRSSYRHNRTVCCATVSRVKPNTVFGMAAVEGLVAVLWRKPAREGLAR
jgi:hypothetical protein